jgi:FtsH-binding integral membrane protein
VSRAVCNPFPVASERFIDRTAGWLGVAFLVTLLASEAALSLPDEKAGGAAVAAFYQAHRPFIVVLQLAGLLGCGLLAVFAWRLRELGRGVAVAGLVLSVAALAPVVLTLAIAVVADPRTPARAGTLNEWEPRGDDLLFLCVTVFAVTVLALGRRAPRWLTVLGGTAALCCALRLASEALGRDRGVLETLAPVSFLVLVGALATVCFRGYRRPRPAQ